MKKLITLSILAAFIVGVSLLKTPLVDREETQSNNIEAVETLERIEVTQPVIPQLESLEPTESIFDEITPETLEQLAHNYGFDTYDSMLHELFRGHNAEMQKETLKNILSISGEESFYNLEAAINSQNFCGDYELCSIGIEAAASIIEAAASIRNASIIPLIREAFVNKGLMALYPAEHYTEEDIDFLMQQHNGYGESLSNMATEESTLALLAFLEELDYVDEGRDTYLRIERSLGLNPNLRSTISKEIENMKLYNEDIREELRSILGS
jgi:hypothetical protein